MNPYSAQDRPPPHHGGAAAQPPPAAPPQGRSLAVAALGLGICALGVSSGAVSVLVALPGIVLGVIAAVRARGPEHRGRVMATIGTSLSGVAVLLAMGGLLLELRILVAGAVR